MYMYMYVPVLRAGPSNVQQVRSLMEQLVGADLSSSPRASLSALRVVHSVSSPEALPLLSRLASLPLSAISQPSSRRALLILSGTPHTSSPLSHLHHCHTYSTYMYM